MKDMTSADRFLWGVIIFYTAYFAVVWALW